MRLRRTFSKKASGSWMFIALWMILQVAVSPAALARDSQRGKNEVGLPRQAAGAAEPGLIWQHDTGG